jgi:deltex
MCIQEQHIKCPVCYQIYGIMTGDQPDGTMNHHVSKNTQCSGYNCGTIIISYSFPSGSRNGKHYSGTHRTAYLPDNDEGREVLALLREGFKRKLLFTVGRSVTTGQDNTTVWNGVHHKTNTSGGSSHFGYPDPTYFDRVKLELAMKGVFPPKQK